MFDDLKIVDYDGDGERGMPDGSSPLDISLSLIVYADSTFKVSMPNKIAADLHEHHYPREGARNELGQLSGCAQGRQI